MGVQEFKFLIFLWRLNIIDSFSVFQLFYHASAQYMGVVVASTVGNATEVGLAPFLALIHGIGISMKYLRFSPSGAELYKRIATVAALYTIFFHGIFKPT